MTDVTIQFLGATHTVTGSRYLVTCGDTRVLVDAGLFQGDSQERQLNWKPFPVPPESLDAMILTHAHLDHCGFLPVVVDVETGAVVEVVLVVEVGGGPAGVA